MIGVILACLLVETAADIAGAVIIYSQGHPWWTLAWIVACAAGAYALREHAVGLVKP